MRCYFCRLWRQCAQIHHRYSHPNRNRAICGHRIALLLLCVVALLVVLGLVIWVEEYHVGLAANWFGNSYGHIVYRRIDMVRSVEMPNRKNITIVVIVDRRAQLAEYPHAQHTVQCYAALHGYPLETLVLSDHEREWRRKCPQSDFMFRRHCMLAHFLAAHPAVQFVLFLDADMGIINPAHLVEEFLPIDENKGESDEMARTDDGSDGRNEAMAFDLMFYERTFNGEIMAGSYIARNSRFAIEFLHFWANYFFHLPHSFHGTDNGAIHAVFLDLFCGTSDCADQRQICSRLWNTSRDFTTLSAFTVCARNVLGARNVFHSVTDTFGAINNNNISVPGKVLLVTDFRKYWARDGWLTSNCWSEHDFIFHGWKNAFLDRPTFARWHSPLDISKTLNKSCRSDEGESTIFRHWPYKESFMRSDGEIAQLMEQIVRQRRADNIELLKHILLQYK